MGLGERFLSEGMGSMEYSSRNLHGRELTSFTAGPNDAQRVQTWVFFHILYREIITDMPL